MRSEGGPADTAHDVTVEDENTSPLPPELAARYYRCFEPLILMDVNARCRARRRNKEGQGQGTQAEANAGDEPRGTRPRDEKGMSAGRRVWTPLFAVIE